MINGTIQCENGRLKLDLDLVDLIGTAKPGGMRVETEPSDVPGCPGESAGELRIMFIQADDQGESQE
jgi:hypothetical protein